MSKTKEVQTKRIEIKAPSMATAVFRIRGTAPLVINKFSQKARDAIRDKQESGSKAKKGQNKEAKDFAACYEAAKHVSPDKWCGIPAGAFRSAMVDACKMVGFEMKLAKKCFFIVADGYDREDGTDLVKITKGSPRQVEHMVRPNGNTVDIRARPMWDPGWEATLRIEYDTDFFTIEDLANLLIRVGRQIGIGEGRPQSKSSCGMGWGLFELKNKE